MAKPTDDTGWQAPQIVTTPQGPAGVIQMATGVEETPCFTCRKWHKDTRKLEQFLKSRGLTPDANGLYEVRTPDLPDRQSMKIALCDWGFCLTLAMPTHMKATCEHWKQRATQNDMEGIIK